MNDSEKLTQALAFHQQGNLQNAEKLYREILLKKPNEPNANHLMGLIFFSQKNFAQARTHIQHAVQLCPSNLDMKTNLAAVEKGSKNIELAENILQEVLIQNPHHPAALANLGNIYFETERFQKAISVLQTSLQVNPNNANALISLANAQEQLHDFSSAFETLQTLINRFPQDIRGIFNRANLLQKMNRKEEARNGYLQCLQMNPNHSESFFNLGNLEISLKNSAAAEEFFLKCLKTNPQHLGASNNLATLYTYANLPEKAEAVLDSALPFFPKDPALLFNHSMACLVQGKYRKGWIGYESRWENPQFGFTRKSRPYPQWNGENIQSKTLLICNEQGIGDLFQFSRFIPQLSEMGARVILECPKSVQELYDHFEGIDSLYSSTSSKIDYYCHITSLGKLLNIESNQIPFSNFYLKAPTIYVQKWQEKFTPTNNLRIGLVWAGNPHHLNDQNRSIPAHYYQDLLSLSKTEYYSLQMGKASTALLSPHVHSLSQEIENYGDTAGILKQLDLLITIDTSIAHLAGALGIPFALLLPYVPDWRWLLNRTDSIWYKSAHLFRQNKVGDWESVIQELKIFIQAKTSEICGN